MSYADFKFIGNCKKILAEGFSDESFQVRPKWEDGTPAHTKKLLHVVDHYQLAQDSIPIMTMRKTGFKTCIGEILWIYQKASNVISELGSHIWDEWDVGNGTIGKAYGYQIGKLHRHHKHTPGENLSDYPSAGEKDGWIYLNQIDAVIWDLRNNPGSRSIITNMYNHEDLSEMGLRPCAYSMTYNVTKDSDGNMVLNSILNQRSQDMLTANNWNAVQYSVLTHMLAQICGMKVGKFTHVIVDAHIYDRHIPVVESMIKEYENVLVKAVHNIDSGYDDRTIQELREVLPYRNPKFWINPDIKSFYDFTTKDFELRDYHYVPFDYKIPVAV